MKDNSKTSAATHKQLLDDLHTLVADAEKIMGTEHSDDVLTTLRARFDVAQERLSDFYTNTRKKVVEGAKYTDEAIRSNPYQAVAIAAGVGLVIGLLVSRRSK